MSEVNGKECAHERVTAQCEVTRVGPQGQALMDLNINCAECGEPFVFTFGYPAPQKLRLSIIPANIFIFQHDQAQRRLVVPKFMGIDN